MAFPFMNNQQPQNPMNPQQPLQSAQPKSILGLDPASWLAISAGLLGGQTANDQLSGAMGNLSQSLTKQQEKQQADYTRNQTYQMLANEDPDLAAAVQGGLLSPTDAFSIHYKQKTQAAQPKNTLMSVGKRLYDWNSKTWIDPPEGADMEQPEFGLTPQYGVDAQGNPVLVQLSKDGKAINTKMPEGVTLSKTPIKLDAGTNFILLDPITRQQIGVIPKDVEGAKVQEESGKNIADARNRLASVRQTAAMVDKSVADLKADPGLANTVGPFDGGWGKILPTLSSDTARAQAKIDALKGTAFLQAREMLKGGGAITDYEGQKAEAAMARMNQAQSEADFRSALDDFNTAVQEGVQKLEAAANGQWDYSKNQPAAVVQENQNAGTTKSGLKFTVEP